MTTNFSMESSVRWCFMCTRRLAGHNKNGMVTVMFSGTKRAYSLLCFCSVKCVSAYFLMEQKERNAFTQRK